MNVDAIPCTAPSGSPAWNTSRYVFSFHGMPRCCLMRSTTCRAVIGVAAEKAARPVMSPPPAMRVKFRRDNPICVMVMTSVSRQHAEGLPGWNPFHGDLFYQCFDPRRGLPAPRFFRNFIAQNDHPDFSAGSDRVHEIRPGLPFHG